MIRDIVKYPDPLLRERCERVTAFDEDLQQLACDMVQTLYAAPGIGLAAPQVGVLKRLLLVDLSVGSKEGELFVAVNPEILSAEGEESGEEGCLSIPDIVDVVARPERIVVRAQDLRGDYWELEASDLLARCFCHEIDHLDGVLFIDHLSPLRRNLIKRKLKKLTKVSV